MKDEVIVGIVVGVTAGVAGAIVGNATLRRVQNSINEEKVRDAETEGFKRGYDTLASNPAKMQRIIDRLMKGTAEEE